MVSRDTNHGVKRRISSGGGMGTLTSWDVVSNTRVWAGKEETTARRGLGIDVFSDKQLKVKTPLAGHRL